MTAYAKTVTKTYDANGNAATEAYPTDANLSLVRSWDDIDQLVEITDGTNTIASYTHVGMRPKGTTFGNGATEARSYTGFRSEVASILHQTSGSSTIVQLDYGYNKMHSRTWERFGGSGSSGDGFAYDKLERLTTAWMGSVQPSSPSGQQYVKKIDYNYDDDGNRSSVVTTLWNQSPTSRSYSTNNLNEYTSVGGTSQSHDANGNLTDNGTLLFKYDYRNLIVQVIRKSDSVTLGTYRYDALGRRVEKNTSAGVERHIRSIVGEPGRTVENFSHVVSTYDGSNNWQQNFVWSDEIDGIVMLEQADVLDHDTDGNTTEVTRSYYHRNALGSVVEISDALEATAVSYRYDPYGGITITRGGSPQSTDPLNQHWTFTGRFYDEEGGLYYYRARFYEPEIGRFAQRDPLGYEPGPNLYEYVGSNPQSKRDPAGKDDFSSLEAHVKTAFPYIPTSPGYVATEDGTLIPVNPPMPAPKPKPDLSWLKPAIDIGKGAANLVGNLLRAIKGGPLQIPIFIPPELIDPEYAPAPPPMVATAEGEDRHDGTG